MLKTRDQRPRRPWMRTVKHFTHRKNRQATRQAIHHGQLDRIPARHLVATEDPWGWD